MKRKVLIWLLGPVGLLVLAHGCHTMAKEMSNGEILYRSKCSSCHNLIEPCQFDKEEWDIYIDKYGQKITVEEKELLSHYLGGRS